MFHLFHIIFNSTSNGLLQSAIQSVNLRYYTMSAHIAKAGYLPIRSTNLWQKCSFPTITHQLTFMESNYYCEEFLAAF